MKKLIIMIFAVMFVFVACSDKDTEESKQKTKEAEKSFSESLEVLKNTTKNNSNYCDYEYEDECEDNWDDPSDLDDIDFTKSYKLFDEAVKADSSNLDAQLGASITRILSLLQDENFVLLKNAWWNARTVNLSNTSLNADRLTISTFVNQSLKPSIKYSLERIEAIDKPENKDYIYTITPEFYGEEEGDDFQLDMTEIKIFHAFLIAADAAIDLFNSYKTELSDYSIEGIKTALTKGSDFLTLLDATKLVSAHNKVKLGIDKGVEALDFLLKEVDDQDDDILRNTYRNRAEIYEAKEDLINFQNMLVNSYTIKTRVNLIMNIKNIIDNPIADLKTLFPDYTVEINDSANNLRIKLVTEDKASLEFPDSTFGNLFPNASQDDIKLMMGIYECNANVECEYQDDHCTEDFECEWGRLCNQNEDCNYDDHCGAEGFCEYGRACTDNSNCDAEYQHCGTNNLCEYGKPCTENNECNTSYQHCGAENFCKDGATCSSNYDCRNWQHCANEGVCLEGNITCNSDSDCGSYEVCSEGYCTYE